MTPELRAELKNLVFSSPSPYLSLDNRLRPFLDLVARIEAAAVAAERERAAGVIDAEIDRLAVAPDQTEYDRALCFRFRHLAAAIRALT